jgi:hypothetical protein
LRFAIVLSRFEKIGLLTAYSASPALATTWLQKRTGSF